MVRSGAMSQHERLPDRCDSETFDIEVGGRCYRVTASRYADGWVGEIFINNNNSGSDSDVVARDSAVVCSIALQYGVPLDVILRALMRDSQGRPNRPLGAVLDRLATEGDGERRS